MKKLTAEEEKEIEKLEKEWDEANEKIRIIKNKIREIDYNRIL